MSSENRSSSGGISFAGLLAIVFIVLKLCHVIAWSWLWVLCPLWITVAVAFTFWMLFLCAAAVVALLGSKR